MCLHDTYGQSKKCGYKSTLELRIGRNSAYSHGHSIQTVTWFQVVLRICNLVMWIRIRS